MEREGGEGKKLCPNLEVIRTWNGSGDRLIKREVLNLLNLFCLYVKHL